MLDERTAIFARAAALLDGIRQDGQGNTRSMIGPLIDLSSPQPITSGHVAQARDCISHWMGRLDLVLSGDADRYTKEAYNMVRNPRPDRMMFAISMLISYQNTVKTRGNNGNPQ